MMKEHAERNAKRKENEISEKKKVKDEAIAEKVVEKSEKVKLKTWDGATVGKLEANEIQFPEEEKKVLVRLTIAGLSEDGTVLDPRDVYRVPPGRLFLDSMSRIKTQASLRETVRNVVTLSELSCYDIT
jgi:hypothetical protein